MQAFLCGVSILTGNATIVTSGDWGAIGCKASSGSHFLRAGCTGSFEHREAEGLRQQCRSDLRAPSSTTQGAAVPKPGGTGMLTGWGVKLKTQKTSRRSVVVVHPRIEPEACHIQHRVLNRRIVKIEIGLRCQEVVQILLVTAQTYQSAWAEPGADRLSANHGCWSEVCDHT